MRKQTNLQGLHVISPQESSLHANKHHTDANSGDRHDLVDQNSVVFNDRCQRWIHQRAMHSNCFLQ
jgi:hypothetical protein